MAMTIADWQARLLTRQDTKKSAYQYERNVIAFNTWRPMTIETIRPADLAEYVKRAEGRVGGCDDQARSDRR